MTAILRQQWLHELRKHESEISSLSQSLQTMPADLTGHIAFLHAQVMRHQISVALIESRLGDEMPAPTPLASGT